MAFNPEELIFPQQGGTKSIIFTSDVDGDGTWDNLYFDPSDTDKNITGEITNKTANSCVVTVTVDPYTTDRDIPYICHFNQGASPARPFSHSFPITLSYLNNGFNPASNTIVAPYTGQTYSICYMSEYLNAIDWDIEVTAGSELVTIKNIVKKLDYVQFDMVVAPNTSKEIIDGSIQLTKYIKFQGNTVAQTPDPFLFKMGGMIQEASFNPKELIFSQGGGTKSIVCNSEINGDGTWDNLYIDPSDTNKNITGEITNKTANSCTVTLSVDPYTTDRDIPYICHFNQGASPARPYPLSFPFTLMAYKEGFNPASNTIIAPYTGQTYSIYYLSDINNAIDWNVEVTAGGGLVSVKNIVKTEDAVRFDMVVAPNTGIEKINGSIQLTKYIKFQGNTIGQTPDPFLFKIDAITPIVDITPSSPQNFASEGGSKTISLSANYGDGINYTATVDSAASSWLSASVSQSGRNGTITVNAAANKSTTASRSGNIQITYGDYSSTYTITQDKAPRIEGKIEVLDPIFDLNFTAFSGKSRIRLTNISNISLNKNVSWINYSNWIDSAQKNMEVYFDVKENRKNENRQGIITISGNDPQGDAVTNKIVINQEGYNIAPICQDTYYNYNTVNTYIDYTLNQGDQLIYSGRAYKMPNADYIRFNVNKLASPYLSSNLPDGFPNIASDSFHFYTNPQYYRDFTIKDKDQNILFEYRFFNDWSYNFDNVINRENSMGIIVLSDPIKKIVDRRQFFFYSAFLPLKKGNSENIDIDYKLRNSKTGATKMRGYDRLATERLSLLIDHNLISFKDYDLIDIAQDTYKIVDSCCEYALYYNNAYGGWDSLLVEGNNLKSDKITSNSYVRSFDNNTVEFEKKKYLNIIQPKYTLYTGYLTDDEASRMWHLLESTEVYLHNLVTDEIKPANITDTTCDYKTFENQGKKKFNYTIKLEIAQEKLRK